MRIKYIEKLLAGAQEILTKSTLFESIIAKRRKLKNLNSPTISSANETVDREPPCWGGWSLGTLWRADQVQDMEVEHAFDPEIPLLTLY